MRTVANAALPAVPGSLEADRGRAAGRRATPGPLAKGRGRAGAGRATPGSLAGGQGRASTGRVTPGSGRAFRVAATHTGGHIR